jgi:hypothetical protein
VHSKTLKFQPYLDAAFDFTIKWLKGSELHIILNFIQPVFPPVPSRICSSPEPSSHSACQINNTNYQIVGMERKKVSSFTETSSHQLYSLQTSSRQFRNTFLQFVSHLKEFDDNPAPDLDSSSFFQDIQSLNLFSISGASCRPLHCTFIPKHQWSFFSNFFQNLMLSKLPMSLHKIITSNKIHL